MRFLRVVIPMWLLLLSLIIVAKLFGYAIVETNPLREIGFDVCDGQPCFLELVPGITTGQQAHELLSQYDDILPYIAGGDILARVNNIGFALIIDDNTNKIISIQIAVAPRITFPQLDDFIAMYGLPCAVAVSKDPPSLTLNYPNMSLGSHELQGRFSLYAELWYVALASTEVSTHRCQYSESEGYSVRPWRGFTVANRYKHS
jgi:hypothetical protein